MTDENIVLDRRMSRRNFLLTLTAGGAVVALGDGRILAGPEGGAWPEDVEQFPALACDGKDAIWMASVVRPMPDRHIRIERVNGGKRKTVCILRPRNMTGIAAPAIAPLQEGCIVAFPVEEGGQWRIAYAFVRDTTERRVDCQYLPCKGSSNISPAVAVVDDRAHIVWESNSGESRGIYASYVDRRSVGPALRLSSPGSNSYNPSIIALADGAMFAAWDSLRADSANIYGAKFQRGKWLAERRITDGQRIERHPFLTSRNNEIWMAWQAQTYTERRLNNLSEQRIAVARLTDKGLEAPVDLFGKVSTRQRLLMRPRIAFDPDGCLWLTASLGMKKLQAGWKPVVWQYSGGQWSEMQSLSIERAKSMATYTDGLRRGFSGVFRRAVRRSAAGLGQDTRQVSRLEVQSDL